MSRYITVVRIEHATTGYGPYASGIRVLLAMDNLAPPPTTCRPDHRHGFSGWRAFARYVSRRDLARLGRRGFVARSYRVPRAAIVYHDGDQVVFRASRIV